MRKKNEETRKKEPENEGEKKNSPLKLVLRLGGSLQGASVLHDLGHLLQQRIRLHDPDGQRHEARDVHADEVAEVGERGHARGLVNVARAGTSLAPAPALATVFPNTNLGNQLKMAARLIAASSSLNLKRQVFFVQIGGWDTHAAQLNNTDPVVGSHAGLLQQVSQGLNAFYNATVELGAANQVTTFTASDFGRTYRSNGDGSDHGWGNHQMIVGGAVKGGDIYGKMPNLTIGGPDDTAQGRWIPTTSVDEYAGTLASWFGVSATDLPIVLPNIGRFAKPNLGFGGMHIYVHALRRHIHKQHIRRKA